MIRIPYEQVVSTLADALRRRGLPPDDAELCARLVADADRDGVPSHGLARFPRLVKMIESGVVDPAGRAEAVARKGPMERWDGRRGPGNVNAYRCMARAIDLAREHGLGCVALADTGHWMRGGRYGWQAAEAGVVGICWTNTMPNLPPWGADEPRIGNNPLVIAVPRAAGPIVLDMAMSQFSLGALDAYRRRGEPLPVDGGFDADGELTRDAAAILATGRPVPTGFWKGSGLALVLDLLAAMLSGGRATHEIPRDPLREHGLSQLFLAIDPAATGPPGEAERISTGIVGSLPDGVRYPAERELRVRQESLALGVPLDPALWDEVRAL